MTTKRKALAAVATVAVVGALPTGAQAATTLVGSGSSASTPYVEALIKGYKKVKPGVNITYLANNGNAGAKDVQAGRSQFAINTRPPLPADSGLAYSKLFLDALTISVNPQNKLNNITIAQTKDIFTGKVTDWSAFPDSGFGSSPISAFGRPSTAGLYTFFTQAVLGGEAHGTNVAALDKDGEVAVAVSKNQQGIGYVGLANSKPASGVKRLSVNGVAPTQDTIRKLKYPLSRYAWLVTSATNPSKEAQAFGDWIRLSYEAGVILDKAGAVPVFNADKPKKKKSKKKK